MTTLPAWAGQHCILTASGLISSSGVAAWSDGLPQSSSRPYVAPAHLPSSSFQPVRLCGLQSCAEVAATEIMMPLARPLVRLAAAAWGPRQVPDAADGAQRCEINADHDSTWQKRFSVKHLQSNTTTSSKQLVASTRHNLAGMVQCTCMPLAGTRALKPCTSLTDRGLG